MTPPQTFVGIDVSKRRLDVATLPGGESLAVTNDEAGFQELIQRVECLPEPLIVLEATGGYEQAVARALADASLTYAIVNPRQVREFARGLGLIEKTDKLDSRVLARFAEVVRPGPHQQSSAAAQRLHALVLRRRQIVNMLSTEQNRLKTAPQEIHAEINEHIQWLRLRLAGLEHELRQTLDADDHWRETDRILRSAKGVGVAVSTSLLAELPELGKLSPRQIAKLVGTAPLACDSGQFKGKRMIWGGRASVRTVLYMAAVVAKCHNPTIRCFYERLRAAGKPFKVAIVACMRKLLVILNAMIRDARPWQSPPIPQTA
jgi:transposase